MKKVFLCLLFCLGTIFTAGAQSKLTVEVSGIEKAEGQIMIGLYDSKSGDDFEDKSNIRLYAVVAVSRTGKISYTFESLKAGTYGIALYQDLNSNRKLDKNFIGIPKEPFGFSNNPQGLRKPKFSEISFIIDGKSPKTTTIKLR